MAGSVSVAVRKAVIDGLSSMFAALPDFNGTTSSARKVRCSYAYPFGQEYNEVVHTGRSSGDTPPAAIRAGRNVRDESGTFDLNIVVRIAGGNAQAADLRIDLVGERIEDWLADRKNNELGVTGLQTLKVVSWDGDYIPLDPGIASLRSYRVEYTARLT